MPHCETIGSIFESQVVIETANLGVRVGTPPTSRRPALASGANLAHKIEAYASFVIRSLVHIAQGIDLQTADSGCLPILDPADRLM